MDIIFASQYVSSRRVCRYWLFTCRLCLAKVWKEKRGHSNMDVSMESIECPFCRQPWYRYPEINGKLR